MGSLVTTQTTENGSYEDWVIPFWGAIRLQSGKYTTTHVIGATFEETDSGDGTIRLDGGPDPCIEEYTVDKEWTKESVTKTVTDGRYSPLDANVKTRRWQDYEEHKRDDDDHDYSNNPHHYFGRYQHDVVIHVAPDSTQGHSYERGHGQHPYETPPEPWTEPVPYDWPPVRDQDLFDGQDPPDVPQNAPATQGAPPAAQNGPNETGGGGGETSSGTSTPHFRPYGKLVFDVEDAQPPTPDPPGINQLDVILNRAERGDDISGGERALANLLIHGPDASELRTKTFIDPVTRMAMAGLFFGGAVPSGTLDEGLDEIQSMLGTAGLVPGLEIADGANAIISGMRGDLTAASLSLIAMVPIVGDTVGKGGTLVKNYGKKVIEAAEPVAAKVAKVAKGGTYKLIDTLTTKVMRTGRTKDLLRRKVEHFRDKLLKDFEFQVDRYTDDYFQQRGREEIINRLYDAPLDKIRAIRPNHPKLQEYLDAAKDIE